MMMRNALGRIAPAWPFSGQKRAGAWERRAGNSKSQALVVFMLFLMLMKEQLTNNGLDPSALICIFSI